MELPLKYDCIWMQFVATYIVDKDLITILNQLKFNLKKNGVIIIKETIEFGL